MHVRVGEGHTLKPAALKCALAADCEMERDHSETADRDSHNTYILDSPSIVL